MVWGRGYHTAAFSRACGPLRDYYRSLALSAPKLELWSCATAARFPDDPEGVLELALRHWSRTVRFRETTEAMYEQGVRVFVEVGPGSSLTNFVANTLQKRPHAAIPLNVARRSDLEQFCRGLAMLAAQGVSLDLAPLYRRRNPRPVRLDEPPPRPPARPPILNQALPELTISEATRMRWVQGAGSRPEAARLGHSPCSPLPAPCSLPLLVDRVLQHEPGKKVLVECDLEPGRHRYLLDHQFFGPDPSRRDPGLTTLLVMPLAATLELIAEAAAVLCPGLKVAALRNVRTYNWLYLQNARQCIRVEAAVLADGAVRAVVTDGEAKIAEAEVEGSGEQGAGSTEPCTPCSPLPAYPWPQEAVYGQVLFHGPGFQAIRSIDGFSPAVSRATVEEPDPCLLVAGDAGRLLLPISLIDVAGQLVGVMLAPSWTEDEVFLTFPNGIERLEFGRGRPAASRSAP